jgi:hypothetical protein
LYILCASEGATGTIEVKMRDENPNQNRMPGSIDIAVFDSRHNPIHGLRIEERPNNEGRTVENFHYKAIS